MTVVLWLAVALMLVGAVLLVVDIGTSAVWIAAIAIGIALVAIDRTRRRQLSGS
jgi:hypothetical protein